MKTVVKVENLSKSYQVQTKQSNGTLRDTLVSIFKNPFRINKFDPFWALDDVSFDVKEGETFGIVGHNGAGKSTLLKILSRITKPTRGGAELRGRIVSLLEVGTGFHSELSGRENIFLNGAILGMNRHEIEKKFDEIVCFAEVEEFLDMPVKFYSSGMYMRLAFAVAAHLEPEILIVDEVLAVGDVGFQKKSLGKMSEVAKSGRTVLFVSHNTATLHRLCKTGLYLERGRAKSYGSISSVLAQYQADFEARSSTEAEDRQSISVIQDGTLRFLNQWQLINAETGLKHSLYSREEACFEFTFVSKCKPTYVHFKLTIRDEQLRDIIIAHNLLSGVGETLLKPGIYKIAWRVLLPIKSGSYKLFPEVYATSGEGILDIWEASPSLSVLPVLEYEMPNDFQGIVNSPVNFKISAA